MFLSSTSSIWPLLKYFSCFLLRDVTSNAVLYEIRYFLRIWSLTGLIRLHTISAASLVHQTNSFSVVFSLLLCPKLQYHINLRITCPICCILMVISNPTWDKLGLVFSQQVVWQFTVKWPLVFKPCSPPPKTRGRPNLHIIDIHEIRNPNNKTIESPNICYLSQQLDSTKLTDIIIMNIKPEVLHWTLFEYLFNLISFLNILSLMFTDQS